MRQVPDVIDAATIGDAWCASAKHLLAQGDRLNLLVHVASPTAGDEQDLRPLDPARLAPQALSVFDVAATIFPKRSTRWSLAPIEFVKYYLPVYARLKRRRRSGWGFYFHRLASFGKSATPQLAQIVDGLAGWGYNHHGAFVVHTCSPETDRPRPQGGPCWQYGQFMADGGRLSLTAVYRSHHYFLKALGNFVGLSRLLAYVCLKTGHQPGTLTFLSTYAFLGNYRTAAEKLLRDWESHNAKS